MNLNNIYEQTALEQSIVFIPGIGMDPTDKILELSEQLGKTVQVLSLADGLENVVPYSYISHCLCVQR